MKALVHAYLVFGLVLYSVSSVPAAQSPPPKTPPGPVLGPAQPVSNGVEPGDNDGAVGRTYIVQKANAAGFIFTNRSTGLDTPSTAANFWPILGPGGTTFTPSGDARVLYDPYGPAGCTSGGGRWIAIERGQLCDSGCLNITNAIVLGVSTGEDPTPSNPRSTNWTFMFYASPISNPPPMVAIMDQPRIGFNTNWIAATVDFYDANNDSALFVWPKYQAECSANIATSLFTFGALNTATGASISRACVAETYQTYGQDLDGSTLYLATPNDRLANGNISPTANSICLSSITGTPQAPVYHPNINCPVESGSTWSTSIPNLIQAGTTQKIDNSAADDRFNSCVVRNYGIWAAQNVGLPANTPTSVATQWWNVGVDNYLGGIYDFHRIGAGNDSLAANAIYPSVGVNYYSDLLVGYTQVSSTTAPSSAYMYRDYRDSGTQNLIYVYDAGLAPYVNGGSDRLGDYGHSTDDPNDDFTLWTTEGFSHSLVATQPNNYGWQSSYAFVYPHTTPFFVDWAYHEGECPTPNATCTNVITPPTDLVPGDLLLVNLALGAVSSSNPTIPAGWSLLPIHNLNNITQLSSSDACNFHLNSWLAAHVYQQGESSYTFTHFDNGLSTCIGPFQGEFDGFLAAYRGASSDLNKLTIYGYPSSSDSNSFSVPSASPPGNTTLATIFTGPGDGEGGTPEDVYPAYTAVSGSPALTMEPSFSSQLADISVPSSGTSYGGYSTSDSIGRCTGVGCLWWAWQAVIAP